MDKDTVIGILKNMDIAVADMVQEMTNNILADAPVGDEQVKIKHDVVVKAVVDKYKELVKGEGLSKKELETIIVTMISNLFLNRLEAIVKETTKKAIMDEAKEQAGPVAHQQV